MAAAAIHMVACRHCRAMRILLIMRNLYGAAADEFAAKELSAMTKK
jgi:hypothetical protein